MSKTDTCRTSNTPSIRKTVTQSRAVFGYTKFSVRTLHSKARPGTAGSISSTSTKTRCITISGNLRKKFSHNTKGFVDFDCWFENTS